MLKCRTTRLRIGRVPRWEELGLPDCLLLEQAPVPDETPRAQFQSAHLIRARRQRTLKRVPVHYSGSWSEAVDGAGPETDSDISSDRSDLMLAGDLFAATCAQRPSGTCWRDIRVVNFGVDVTPAQVFRYGTWQGLGPVIDPWTCLAIAKHLTGLDRVFNVDLMELFSLTHCLLHNVKHVPSVRWRGEGMRSVRLTGVGESPIPTVSAWSGTVMPGGIIPGANSWFGYVVEEQPTVQVPGL